MSKIDQVIVSANNDPKYLDHWPRIARCWKRLGFRPVLAWVTNDHSRYNELAESGPVFAVYPIPGVPEGNLAKVSRFLLAQTMGGVSMLSDADMMPINGEYFHEWAAEYGRGTLLSLSSDAYEAWAHPNRHPICYLIADRATWHSLVNPDGLSNVDLIATWTGRRGVDDKDAIEGSPFSDESLLQWMIGRWPGQVVGQERRWHRGIANRRVDRADWGWDADMVAEGHYIDAHLPRPVTAAHALDDLERYVK